MDESHLGIDKPPVTEAPIDEDVPVTTTVVEAVAAASNTPMDELPSLHRSVDTDAVETIFANRSTDGRVTFRYAGFTISIHYWEEVTVHETGIRPPR